MSFAGRFQEKFISTSFQNLGLSAELLRAVAEQGYTEPTPIQAQAIPLVLSGRDLIGAAQTGTGKTAGFTLPMLQLLTSHANYRNSASTSPARHPVRALILVPTRELAAQVRDSVRTYGKHLRLRTAMIFGGMSMALQVTELRRGVDIVVATPGRLLDHVQQRTIDLRSVEILVLDEADRMLDMGFIHDIRRILALLPAKRQNLLFSATFSDEIRKPRHSGDCAAQCSNRAHQPAGTPGGQGSQTRSALAPGKDQQLAAGAGVHQDQARRQSTGAAAR